MIGFLAFLLVVFAAGFIYLTIQGRWKVTVGEKDKSEVTTKVGASTVKQTADVITITAPKAPKINFNGAVSFEETYNKDLPKSAPRVNQVHMERRMFERPRRKVKK